MRILSPSFNEVKVNLLDSGRKKRVQPDWLYPQKQQNFISFLQFFTQTEQAGTQARQALAFFFFAELDHAFFCKRLNG